MAEPKLYTKGRIFVFNEDGAGGLVAECTSFSVDFNTNDNDVVTLADGFTGITPGAGTVSVSIDTAVPRTGFEMEWHTWAKERKIIEITGHRGASTISCKGFIKRVGEQHGTDGSTASIELSGGEPDIG